MYIGAPPGPSTVSRRSTTDGGTNWKLLPSLEAQRVHVDALESLGVRVAGEVVVDPRVEIEVRFFEGGELAQRRRPADQIDRQRAVVAIVGQRWRAIRCECDRRDDREHERHPDSHDDQRLFA